MVKLIRKILLAIGLAGVVAGSLAKAPVATEKVGIKESPCAFSLSDPFNGRLESAKISADTWGADYITDSLIGKSNDLHLTFSCAKIEPVERACENHTLAKFNGAEWVPKSPASAGSKRNIVLLNLDKKIWNGLIYVESDTTGPIRYQLRSLQFCLANSNGWTLWGGSVVDNAPYNPKESTESEAIRLIKSIEFLPQPEHQ